MYSAYFSIPCERPPPPTIRTPLFPRQPSEKTHCSTPTTLYLLRVASSVFPFHSHRSPAGAPALCPRPLMFALAFWRHRQQCIHLYLVFASSLRDVLVAFFSLFGVAAVAASGAVSVPVVGPVEHKITEPSSTTMTTGHHSTRFPSLPFSLRDEVVRSLAVVRR